MSPSPDHSAPCPSCGAPLAGGQRYCLACGARAAAPTVDYRVLWGGADATDPAAPETPAPEDPAAADPAIEAGNGLRERLRRLPRAVGPVAAAVALLLGVAAGTIASAGAGSSAAADPGRQVLFLGGRGAAPTSTAPAVVAEDPVEDQATDDATLEDAAVAPVAAAAVAPTAAADDPAAGDTSDDTGGDDAADDLGGDTGDGDTPDTALTNVWIITLAHRPDWFAAASPAPYLARDLAAAGAVLTGYAPVATGSVPAGVALLSGQGPTDATRQDCPVYADVQPATLTAGLAGGAGCVYPAGARTLADQLAKAGTSWRAYVEGQGATGCRRPPAGGPDPWRDPAAADGFLTARNPFVYFHSITDSPACGVNVTDLTALATDLATSGTVPALSWIVPGTRRDGRDPAPGGDGTGGPAAADAFLREVVPKIQATEAYQAGGLIAIVPDGPATVDPALPAPPATGALLLSPLVRPGATVPAATGPYGLLRTLEDRLGLGHLGHAGDAATTPLGDDVFTTPTSEALR